MVGFSLSFAMSHMTSLFNHSVKTEKRKHELKNENDCFKKVLSQLLLRKITNLLAFKICFNKLFVYGVCHIELSLTKYLYHQTTNLVEYEYFHKESF